MLAAMWKMESTEQGSCSAKSKEMVVTGVIVVSEDSEKCLKS
jgi:hypothetical protein